MRFLQSFESLALFPNIPPPMANTLPSNLHCTFRDSHFALNKIIFHAFILPFISSAESVSQVVGVPHKLFLEKKIGSVQYLHIPLQIPVSQIT